jgi:hypothetical protein
MKIEQTECSETSAYKIQMLGNYPEKSIQHSEQGESLKLRKFIWIFSLEIRWKVRRFGLLDATLELETMTNLRSHMINSDNHISNVEE